MASIHSIPRAVEILKAGGLVAFPTETVYGLGADADQPAAVAKIFAVKGRPSNHPLIVHLAATKQLADWVRHLSREAELLAERFWPGPMTLILPRASRVLDAVTGGQATVGLRIPSHPVARELLAAFGGGIAAPSANRFGRVSPTRADHVQEELGDLVDLILRGGDCEVGLESTIIDCSGESPAILRPGAVTREAIEGVLGRPLTEPGKESPRASGRLESHYAPQASLKIVPADARLELAVELARKGRRVALLAPEGTAAPNGVKMVALADEGEAFARGLYAALREVDRIGAEIAVVSPPTDSRLSEAIRDRLQKAAAPRP